MYRVIQITIKVYESIKWYNQFNKVIKQYEYYIYEFRKIPFPYRLLLNLSKKMNLKRSDKYVALSSLSIC